MLKMIDVDNGGWITFKELEARLKRVRANLNESDIVGLMKATIAERAYPKRRTGLEEMLKMIDADNGGWITFTEPKAGLERVGANLNESDIVDKLQAAAMDNSGTIDYREFIATTTTLHLNKIEREGLSLTPFSYFDKDMTRFISPETCEGLDLKDAHIEGMMRNVNKCKDGQKECSYYMWMHKFQVKHEHRVERRSEVEDWLITLAFPFGEWLGRGNISPSIYALSPTELVTTFAFLFETNKPLGFALGGTEHENLLGSHRWNDIRRTDIRKSSDVNLLLLVTSKLVSEIKRNHGSWLDDMEMSSDWNYRVPNNLLSLAGNPKASSKEIQTREREDKKKKHKSVEFFSLRWDTCYSNSVGEIEIEYSSNTDSSISDSDEEDLSDNDSDDPESDLDENDEELKGKMDPNGIFMVVPSRFLILDRLPLALRVRLKHHMIDVISHECAKIALGEERFNLLLATNPREQLGIHDSKCRIFFFWRIGKLPAEFILDKVARKILNGAAGFIRDQGDHVLCWAYSVCDLISMCRVLYGWDEEFKPLSPVYLCQNVNPEAYEREIDTKDKHRCYGNGHIHGLFYVQENGMSTDRPEEEEDCRQKIHSVGNKCNIRDIFKYDTLEEALIRLKTHHPVIATLICFDGWDRRSIYRGPVDGAKYVGTHSVIMVDCIELDGETIVICKSSNGRELGYDGYIRVSSQVMLLAAGATRKASHPHRCMCVTKPTHLLRDFFSIDMDMGPKPIIKENLKEVEENAKYAITDGRNSSDDHGGGLSGETSEVFFVKPKYLKSSQKEQRECQ